MRRHSWKNTGSQRGFDTIERCAHCGSERVSAPGTETLYEYRGGKAQDPRTLGSLPQDGSWRAFPAGIIPQCMERP
jgi:hypothetical protein